MTFLVFQIFWFLLIAVMIGAVAAWLIRRNVDDRREAIIQRDWRDRLRQAQLDRDRAVRRLSSEIDGMRKAGFSPAESSAAARENESLIAKLEGQVAEREDAIAGQRSEITSLRDQLIIAGRAAEDRDAALRSKYEDDIAALQARLEQQRLGMGERKAGIAKLESAVSEREADIAKLESAVSEREAGIAKLESAVSEREAGIAKLESAVSEREADIAKLESAVSEREADIEKQKSAIGERDDSLVAAREAAAQQAQEQELIRLSAKVEQATVPMQQSTDDQRIRELKTALQQRDDSIAVLRDDIAELTGHASDRRGRQDQMLRSAMEEARSWQEKYEEAAKTLAQRDERPKKPGGQTADSKAATTKDDRESKPTPSTKKRQPRGSTAAQSQRSRTAGDRIASLMSRPNGPSDNLREIKGVGPVLEKMLNEIGIHHFRQIADFDAGDVARVAREIGRFGNRIERDDWVRQARKLHQQYHG